MFIYTFVVLSIKTAIMNHGHSLTMFARMSQFRIVQPWVLTEVKSSKQFCRDVCLKIYLRENMGTIHNDMWHSSPVCLQTHKLSFDNSINSTLDIMGFLAFLCAIFRAQVETAICRILVHYFICLIYRHVDVIAQCHNRCTNIFIYPNMWINMNMF